MTIDQSFNYSLVSSESNEEASGRWKTAPLASEEPAPAAARVAAPRPRHDLIGRATDDCSTPATWTWCGTAGGVGATSLAAQGQGVALAGLWPTPTRGWPSTTVLVCRSSMASLNAAGRFLQEWASGQVPDLRVVGLVVSADAPSRPPRAVRARLYELSPVTTVWHLPWIGLWRETPYATHPVASAVVAKVAAQIERES